MHGSPLSPPPSAALEQIYPGVREPAHLSINYSCPRPMLAGKNKQRMDRTKNMRRRDESDATIAMSSMRLDAVEKHRLLRVGVDLSCTMDQRPARTWDKHHATPIATL